MERRASYLFTAALAAMTASAAASGDVFAGANDDQANADAAIAAFDDDMLEAGAVSDGPQDTTPSTEEEIAAENPGLECFGDFGTGLDAGGRLEGETARAFSDNFTLPATDEVPSTDPTYHPGGDSISAAVVTLDDEHQDTLDQLVGFAGSDDVATCLEDSFQAAIAAELATADTTGGSEPPSYEIDVSAEPDIGIGDSSAQFALLLTTTYQGATYVYNTYVYLARVDRSIALVNVTSNEAELESDIDPLEILGALVDAI
jgi:hypothetical protein